MLHFVSVINMAAITLTEHVGVILCQNRIRDGRHGGTIIFAELVFLKMQKIVKVKHPGCFQGALFD